MRQTIDWIKSPSGGLAFLGLWLCMIVNMVIPVLRSPSPVVNYLCVALIGSAPFLFLLHSNSWQGWQKRMGKEISAVLAIPGALFLFTGAGCAGCTALLGDGSFEVVREEIHFGERVVVYQTNGGATTSYGIDIRQECTIFPGLNAVRVLARQYPAYEVEIVETQENRLKFTFPTYPDKRVPDPEEIVKLRRGCWGWAV